MNLRKLILIAFVFSGAAALIYEVTWTRPLQFVLGSTIYTTSIIFAAFMAGLSLGSIIISKFVDKIKNLPRAYALMELSIGIYGALLLLIFNLLPRLYRFIFTLHENFYLFELSQFLLTFLVLLIPTTLMGATFPIIVKFYTKEKIGKGIGEIYSANNIGAIIGSFSAGFLLIPLLGIKASIILAAIINIVIAIFILFVVSKNLFKKLIPIVVVLFLILIYTGNYDIDEIHTSGFSARFPKEVIKAGETLYYKEGIHATVTVKELVPRGLALFINGKGQGSTVVTDLRVNFLLAYLPLVLKQESEKILVLGLGTGTTSGQIAQIKNVTTIEIEPAVVDATKHFLFMNLNVLKNPNHNLIIADGRNYLMKSKENYDVIIPEPCDPWQSFSSALYSKEFFELGKKHLSEEGIYIQWVPIYELDIEDFKSFYKTFNSVFPHVVAFVNIKEDEELLVKLRTSEIILIGSKEKIKLDEEKIKKNFDSLPLTIKNYFADIGIDSSEKLLHLFFFTSEQMEGYADDAELITDDKPKLEFSTAQKVRLQNPEEVTQDIENFLEKNPRESFDLSSNNMNAGYVLEVKK